MANGAIWPTYMYSSRILPPSIHHVSEDLCAMYCHVDTSCSFYMYINTTCHLGNCSPIDVLNPDQTSSTAPLYFKKGKMCFLWKIPYYSNLMNIFHKCIGVKSKFYKKRGATFFMTSHVSSALSTLPNIGQNHQVSSNLTSFWQFLCKEVVKKPITELMCDVIKKVAPRFL